MTPGSMMSMRKSGARCASPVDLVNLTIDHRAGKAGGQTASCCLLGGDEALPSSACRADSALSPTQSGAWLWFVTRAEPIGAGPRRLQVFSSLAHFHQRAQPNSSGSVGSRSSAGLQRSSSYGGLSGPCQRPAAAFWPPGGSHSSECTPARPLPRLQQPPPWRTSTRPRWTRSSCWMTRCGAAGVCVLQHRCMRRVMLRGGYAGNCHLCCSQRLVASCICCPSQAVTGWTKADAPLGPSTGLLSAVVC